jgi:hypothetical protein
MALPIRPGLASLFGFQQNRAGKPFLGSVVRVSHRARSAFMAQHGDAKLTDLLHTLADCPKARSASIRDRCKAVFGQRLP